MNKFEIYRDEESGKGYDEESWRWRLKIDENTVIATTDEFFLRTGVKPAIKKIQGSVTPVTPMYPVEGDNEDTDKYRFLFCKDDSERWRWKLQLGDAENDKPIAYGPESFTSKETVIDGIERARAEICKAGIEFQYAEDDPAYDAEEENRQEGTDETKGIPGS